jgi:DNA polymerase III subunit epsilon
MSVAAPTVRTMTEMGDLAPATELNAKRSRPAVVQPMLWSTGAGGSMELSLDDLALSDVTFVVLDLETTGAAPSEAGITEIGAVKVRGGEVMSEFQTLVRPPAPIPAFITVLTGITNAMVAASPPLSAVLPSFLEFIRGSVLVAHNAPYDIGFLRAACARYGYEWPAATVLDTLQLARHVLSRDEIRNHKLGSLAQFFGASVTPDHRALTDARATVDVLHGLIARIGSLGVYSLGELRRYTRRVPQATRRRRTLADGLPQGPGVYMFHDDKGRVLYVGTSVNIRTRVRTYFTAAEKRSRMGEMIARAAGVTPVPCSTSLEGKVREVRLIAQHAPPYNRRSRNPERAGWVKVTVEPYPRLSIVRQVLTDGATYLGPFTSRAQADLAVAALHEAFPIRRCTSRLPRQPSPSASACLLADLGRCPAPCVGGADEDDYAQIVDDVRAAFTHDARRVVDASLRRALSLSGTERFEEAAVHRDRMLSFLHGAARSQRLTPIASSREVIGARRLTQGGWEFALVRYGRLAGSAVSPPGVNPMPCVEALQAAGEVVAGDGPPWSAALPEETDLVVRWLELPGVRLVELDGTWSVPITGAQSHLHRQQDR